MYPQNIVISLEPRHAERILDGIKTVELRRRRIGVEPGAIVWLYAKRPCAAITGCAVVQGVHSSSLAAIWRRYGAKTGITRAEFFAYFNKQEVAWAVQLSEARRLPVPLSLDMLRGIEGGFSPPQFFKRVSPSDAGLAKLLKKV